MLIEEHISGSILFRNGTKISLSDSNVVSASCRKQCCQNGTFEIGGVYAASLSLTCRIPGTNSYQLRGAEIKLYSQYIGTEAEPYAVGIFWITDARKISGNVYTVTAKDAVGWLDTSSRNYTDEQNRIFDSIAKYFASQASGYHIQDWCAILTNFTDSLVRRITGVSGALSWKHYDSGRNGHFCNQFIWANDGHRDYETSYPVTLFLSMETGSGDSDCPRDLFRYLAEIAGGFIYADTDGKLTLGQFKQSDLGTAQVYTRDIEYDSCEIADFELAILSSSVQSELLDGAADMQIWTDLSDYTSLTGYRVQISSNPFVDGFTAAYIRGDAETTVPNLWTFARGLWNPGLHVRPFQCRVHKTARFQPGQKIIIHTGQEYESILTSVTWNFRGGWSLACGGEDTRTMTDALRMSKADKSLKETRNRCAVLEKKIAGLS